MNFAQEYRYFVICSSVHNMRNGFPQKYMMISQKLANIQQHFVPMACVNSKYTDEGGE